MLLAVNISFTATVSLSRKKWCHLLPPTSKYYSLKVSPASVHVSLGMQELVAGSDKHS